MQDPAWKRAVQKCHDDWRVEALGGFPREIYQAADEFAYDWSTWIRDNKAVRSNPASDDMAALALDLRQRRLGPARAILKDMAEAYEDFLVQKGLMTELPSTDGLFDTRYDFKTTAIAQSYGSCLGFQMTTLRIDHGLADLYGSPDTDKLLAEMDSVRGKLLRFIPYLYSVNRIVAEFTVAGFPLCYKHATDEQKEAMLDIVLHADANVNQYPNDREELARMMQHIGKRRTGEDDAAELGRK
jgi:hypothetical protein